MHACWLHAGCTALARRFIEARSKAGLSPLMYAALYGCTDAAAALLRHGANLYACTTFAAWGLPGSPRANSNVLACAALGKSLACATLLLRYHVSASHACMHACSITHTLPGSMHACTPTRICFSVANSVWHPSEPTGLLHCSARTAWR